MSVLGATITADGVNTLLQKVLDRSSQTFPGGAWKRFGPLRLRFAGASGRAEAGPNAFSVIDPAIGGPRGHIKELDWKWTDLKVGIGLDVPELCVGGWCIIPKPWPFKGCLVRLPRKCFFSADPDLQATLNFAGLRHEISTAFSVSAKPLSGAWGLYVEPEMPLDVDILDLSDMVGDLLDTLIDKLVNDLLGFLPSWARSIIAGLLGGIASFIRRALDFADDLEEWISEKLGVSLGLFDMVASLLIELFYDAEPIYRLPDPYPVLPAQTNPPLPAVALDIVSVKTAFSQPDQTLSLSVEL